MRLDRLIALALCGAALGLACGDDDDEPAAAGGIDRYCELSNRLDRLGTEFFEQLEKQNASPKQFQAAERDFVEQYEDEISELEEIAPEAIRTDVETLVAGSRGGAGLEEIPPAQELGAAEQRVQAFEKRNC